MPDRGDRRRLERHGASVLRTLSVRADVDLRGDRLEVAGRPIRMATPYLSDAGEMTLSRSRGISDGLALLVSYCDLGLHDSLRPEDSLARLLFDGFEQIRCEALLDSRFMGVEANIDSAFRMWCQQARSERVGESAVGVLVYTAIHMVRARVVRTTIDEEVDSIIETTRGRIGQFVAEPLRSLRGSVSSQWEFSEHSRDLAERLAAFAGPITERARPDSEASGFYRLMAPSDWSEDKSTADPGHAGIAGGGQPAGVGGSSTRYCVYTTAFDRVTDASSLYPAALLVERRNELDAKVAAMPVSIHRLADRLRSRFSTPAADGLDFGTEDGALDGRRLAQIVTQPSNRHVFHRERVGREATAAVTFLIDNSGSMKAQRIDSVVTLIDVLSRALDLAGVTNEILGFTTRAWSGGRAASLWRSEGSEPEPGRLNEVEHIVYKSADTSWRMARPAIAAMLETSHFKEGVDGEALLWAQARLLAREESERYLVVISDGAPMDTATFRSNVDGFLANHLRAVASGIESGRRVHLGAIGVDLDVSPYYESTVEIDLSRPLTMSSLSCLEQLFGVANTVASPRTNFGPRR